jgi:hypothetical protein
VPRTTTIDISSPEAMFIAIKKQKVYQRNAGKQQYDVLTADLEVKEKSINDDIETLIRSRNKYRNVK